MLRTSKTVMEGDFEVMIEIFPVQKTHTSRNNGQGSLHAYLLNGKYGITGCTGVVLFPKL
jgi:hypothetical protein